MTKIKSKIPKLRFKEFSWEWKEDSLWKKYIFKNWVNATKEQYWSWIKFINVLDIINNRFINYKNIIWKVNISSKEIDNNLVWYWDIVFQRSSETRDEVWQANVYLDKDKESVFGWFVIRWKSINNDNPVFINYLLKTYLIRKDITTRSWWSTRYNIWQDSLNKIKIILPEPLEQEKIANFLSWVDDSIENILENIELVKEYKKWIMQNIFREKIRFKDENGKDFIDWEEKSLNKIFKERKTYSKKWKEYTHISLTTEWVVPKTARYERDFLVRNDEKEYKITKLNDICYNPANLKFWVIARNKLWDWIFSPIYITFKVIGKNDVKFMEYFVTRRDFIQKARKYEQGTVYERMSVSPSDFIKLNVKVPSKPEQEKISNFLSDLDEKINILIDKSEKLKDFKKWLLQQMFI